MSRSKYYSNAFATIQGEASSCRVDQEGSGNLLNMFKHGYGAVPPAIAKSINPSGRAERPPEGNMPGMGMTFGKTGGKAGGSFGRAALQRADVPSTSHARDLRGSGMAKSNAKKVNVNGGYKFKR